MMDDGRFKVREITNAVGISGGISIINNLLSKQLFIFIVCYSEIDKKNV